MKFIILICFCVFSLSAYSATENTTKKTDTDESDISKKAVVVKNPGYSRSAVERMIKDITREVKKSKKEKTWLPSTRLCNYYKFFHAYYKFPDIELETGVYRKWYKGIYEAFYRMSKASDIVDSAKFNKNRKMFDMANSEYFKGFNQYRDLIKNKKKYLVPDDKMAEMREKKRESEREARRSKRR